MCLDSITQGPNPQEQGEGYKVFRKLSNGELYSVYAVTSSPGKLFQYQPNTWMSDPSNYLLESNDEHCQEYQTGFHLFENEADANEKANCRNQHQQDNCEYDTFDSLRYVVRKVKYRNVTAKGTQAQYSWFDGCMNSLAPTIVAREIFVEEEE